MFEITWPFVAVVVAIISLFSGVVLIAVRFMLLGHRLHVEDSIKVISKDIRSGNEEVKRIERELTNLQISMPNDYVKREDWIRFASVIDAKQDSLNDKLNVTNINFEVLLERMKQE